MQQRMVCPIGLRAILLALLAGGSAGVSGGLVAQAEKTDGKGQQPVNRLDQETSPYLRQHRHNPVDWYPWGPEALQLAKKLDKPIFLSIGYSACHWCHVMAHESFEDPEVAKLMNEKFVCIKVDREERPDVDEIYMAAVQAMTGRGGWPMSLWMTPDARPFYGGTYFPPNEDRGGPSFRRLCEAMAKAWTDRREDVLKGAGEISGYLQKSLAPEMPPGEPKPELLASLLPAMEQRFDADFGGFGQAPQFAPKFPQACELGALLRIDDGAAWRIASKTLHAMRRGGVYDQLGGGFHRYSTDRRWHVPHFEKMLYDNALLVQVYLEASLRSGEQVFGEVARATLDYVIREMQSPAGGYWSTQDAQSEGVEGKFFVWQRSEFDELLGDQADAVATVFGCSDPPNWELGNVLKLAEEPPATKAFCEARRRLFEARAKRIAPATDDKVLASWNGLMLGAMAAGYRVLGDERYLRSAQRAAAFLVDHLESEGRVTRSWQGGAARHRGCLDDHAGLADGLLSVFEADGDPRWLLAAHRILQQTLTHFRAGDGSFYYTADDHEELLTRTKTAYDGSTPSGISLMSRALLRAGLLLGDGKLYGAGLNALRANHGLLAKAPSAAAWLLQAVHFHTNTPKEVVVVGEPGDDRTKALLQTAWRQFPSPCVVAWIHDGNREALAKLSPIFRDKPLRDGAPVAYVCEHGTCQAPTSDPEVLLEQIAAR